ncbi:MAG: ABC transporter ATP-binding protein, partial [Lentisphaeria bacterium]|nr:ABC transporter ATP-binding protein [Lentisphaeria bacterium]
MENNDTVRPAVPSPAPGEGEKAFVAAEHLKKSFRLSSRDILVLKDVSFSLPKGEWTALCGASGSGKTTLLDLLGGLSRPDSGRVCVDGTDLSTLSNSAAVHFRRKNVGFVFQAYHMLPELSICENVMLPALLDGKSRYDAKEHALSLLEKMGLSHRFHHRPNELSGGEQQRAAIARALINSPSLILADEPTGNLDSVTGGGILDIFRKIHAEGVTIVMVTHDRFVASLADRIIFLKDGTVSQEAEEEPEK